MDHNPQGRRGHFHRGRRGPDRRGPERREPPPPDQTNRGERGERVDVEQIMRDIRARISQRSGIELSNQQIQELAARRLEAILDPRALKPGLLDQLRRSAGERQPAPDPAQPSQPVFEELSLYDSPSAVLRFIRRLLNPILRLLFNPTPVAHALALQGRANAEAAARAAERDRRQAEWNALHYEILQRLVTEVSRVSLEAQSLSLRVESLGAKVDFNDRRVRGLEGTHVRAPRPQEAAPAPQPGTSAAPDAPIIAETPATPAEGQPGPQTPIGEAPRRRRRRRRGRRGTGPGAPVETTGAASAAPAAKEAELESDTDDGFDDEPAVTDAMTSREEPVERQAVPEVPLDHRLPAPRPDREEAHSSSTPPRDDSDPGAGEA